MHLTVSAAENEPSSISCLSKILKTKNLSFCQFEIIRSVINHFIVVCSEVAWPLSASEVGVDFVLIQTYLLFTC